MTMTRLEDLLIEHEGNVKEEGRHVVYDDDNGDPIKAGSIVTGNPTIGIGRLITGGRGLSDNEARYLLRNDIQDARRECSNNFSWFNDLDQVRQDAIVNMCFNLGITRLKGFKKMLKAMMEKDYHKAAEEALDSRWSQQVGRRAEDIVHMIIEGKYA